MLGVVIGVYNHNRILLTLINLETTFHTHVGEQLRVLLRLQKAR
jgi:hypothetical protein